MACITGGIAEAYYRVIPDYIVDTVRGILDKKLLDIVDSFNRKFLVVDR